MPQRKSRWITHRPHDEQIELAVIKLRATDPSSRIGTLFVNFGGETMTTAETVAYGHAQIDQARAELNAVSK